MELILMQIHVGSAPDSWGVWFPDDDKQIPWERCLDEIAEVEPIAANDAAGDRT